MYRNFKRLFLLTRKVPLGESSCQTRESSVGSLEPEMPPLSPASSEGSTGMVPVALTVALEVDET
jgi:hypothetical protein